LRTPKFYHAILAFVIVFAYLVFVTPFTAGWGMIGIICTQLVVAGTAIVFAVIIKADFKETFPMKLPRIKYFVGAVFTYGGIYLFTLSVSMAMILLFPAMQDTIDGLSTLTQIMPHPAAAILVIAVMPAICEELLMRGFILSSFKGYGSVLAVIAVGVMFGILHFDPYRFVPTAILGMASAYIVIKTKSLVLPMLYHLVNNTLSVIAMYTLNNVDLYADGVSGLTEYETMKYSYVYSSLICLSIALVLIYIGVLLLNEKKDNIKVTLAVVIVSITLFIIGISYMVTNIDISAYYPQLNLFI
jgi:CAAX amino terminal protease family.